MKMIPEELDQSEKSEELPPSLKVVIEDTLNALYGERHPEPLPKDANLLYPEPLPKDANLLYPEPLPKDTNLLYPEPLPKDANLIIKNPKQPY